MLSPATPCPCAPSAVVLEFEIPLDPFMTINAFGSWPRSGVSATFGLIVRSLSTVQLATFFKPAELVLLSCPLTSISRSWHGTDGRSGVCEVKLQYFEIGFQLCFGGFLTRELPNQNSHATIESQPLRRAERRRSQGDQSRERRL